MQRSSQFDASFIGVSSAERFWSSGALVLFVSLTMLALAFVPLVPPVDVLEGGGLTTRGAIEYGLIFAGVVLLALYAKTKRSLSFEPTAAPFLLVSLFTFWAVLSSIWSPNPFLTIAKSAELWLITLGAALAVSHAARTQAAPGELERGLALSLAAVIGGLLLANLFIWGMLLPDTSDAALPLEVVGEEPSLERPRLILAYAHPLLTADFLALALISLAASKLKLTMKALLFPALLFLLWLASARGPTVGLLIALGAMAVLRMRRNDVRAVAATLIISLCLAVGMFVQDSLVKAVPPLLTEDVYTLNSRTELWTKTIEHISSNPIIGCGYYASRYLLVKDFSWGGHAHNSFLEVFLTTGIVGLLMLLAFVAYLFRLILRTKNGLLMGVTIYTLIQGMLNPLFFYAGLPMFVIVVAALNARSEGARARSTEQRSPAGGGRL